MSARRLAPILFILLLPAWGATCSDIGAVRGNYLGQELPGLQPEPFAVDVLPFGAMAGTFSPDLMEFYFNLPGSGGRAAIAGLRLIEGEWTSVEFIISHAFEPHISPSGDRMFFVIEDGAGGGQGYVSIRGETDWGEPQILPESVNGATHFPMYFTSTLDGTLFWTKLSSDVMLVSAPFADGAYEPARSLGFALNAQRACSHPGVAPDGSYVLFDVEDQGQTDIYVSFATNVGGWTPARKVSELADPRALEMAPSVSPVGDVIFFVRMADDMGIYWIDASILDAYRP